MGIFDKFKIRFKKSTSTFASGLRDIIIKKEINDETLDQVEEYLIQSDVGLSAAEEIKKIIAQEKIDPKKDIMNEINIILKNKINSILMQNLLTILKIKVKNKFWTVNILIFLFKKFFRKII